MNALTPEQREIVARLQSGRLMICDGQADPNSDGCGGQGYTGASGQEPCQHCYGAGVMTPELRATLLSAPSEDPDVRWSAWPETDADSDPSDPDVTYYTEWFVGRWPNSSDEPDCRILIGMGRTAEIIARRVAEKLTSILNTDLTRASVRDRSSEAAETSGSAGGKSPADLSVTPDLLSHLRAENANLRDRVREAEKGAEGMRGALESLVDSLKWSEHTPSVDPIYGAEVEALGRRIGFGALMSSASASWADRLGAAKGGEFVAGPCRSVLKADLRRARAALNPNQEAGDHEPR